MAGLYLHIPFCKQKCTYCDFHFSTNLKNRKEILDAMNLELSQRRPETIHSIYFGGGTPSVLTTEELNRLFNTIFSSFTVDGYSTEQAAEGDIEITLEANPDDLTPAFFKSIRDTPVNRLSIGVQSFSNDVLQWMNRAHRQEEAVSSIKRAQDAGIDNITIDLIFGIPGKSDQYWEEQLETALDLQTPHLSVYQLTVEERTALHHQVKKEIISIPDEEAVANLFIQAHKILTAGEFDHYEISNYAKDGHKAIHNKSYWEGTPYIGIGPSAHSFDGRKRRWNIANNRKYSSLVTSGDTFWEEEQLTNQDVYNEYVMTRLRTAGGIERNYVRSNFPDQWNEYNREIERFQKQGLILREEEYDRATLRGWLLSDHINSILFSI